MKKEGAKILDMEQIKLENYGEYKFNVEQEILEDTNSMSNPMPITKKITKEDLIKCNCGKYDACPECNYCTNSPSDSHSSTCSKNTKKDKFNLVPIAKYYKLNNGVWGIRVQSPNLHYGDVVKVHKNNGDIIEEKIDQLSKNYQYSGYGIYTIQTKYKKGGIKPIEKLENIEKKTYNKKIKKVKSIDTYELFIWEKIGILDIENYKTEADAYNLVTQISKIELEGIELLKNIYDIDKYVILAKYNNYTTTYISVYDKYDENKKDILDILYNSYLKKKEIEENKEKTWIICNLNCKEFPARSQKIKGLRYVSLFLRNIVNTSNIESANVITENTDIENVNHKCHYGKRVKFDEVLDKMVGNFNRPCPPNPEHGFVDSRVINNKEEALDIIEEIRKTGYSPELISMAKVNCAYSAVVTPDRITFGKSNDGATQGENAFEIPLEIGEENKKQLREMFWGDTNWPYAELLYPINDSNELKPLLVQLRAGPELNSESEKIKISKVYEVNSSMDLMEWAKVSKELAKEILIVKDGNDLALGYNRVTPIVYHPGGALSSHFGVHCKEQKLPYITSKEKPIEGSVIDIGLKNPTNLEAIKEGLVLGFHTNITDKNDIYRYTIKKELKNFLGALHIYSMADLGNPEVARLIGYSWAIGTRIISALPLGEARHNTSLKTQLDNIVGQVYIENNKNVVSMNTYQRDIIYNIAWRMDLEKILSCLITSYNGFKNLSWDSSYGGKAWAGCTLSLIKVLTSMRDFLKTQDSNNLSSMVENINIMVNLAHNNGWWLNKLLQKSDFDNAAILPHFFLSPEIAFKLREELSSFGQFGLKLKGFNIIKKLNVNNNIEKEDLGNVKNVKTKNNSTKNNNFIEPSKELDIEDSDTGYIYKEQKDIENIVKKDKYIQIQFQAKHSYVHIQIACYYINRDYGLSVNYKIDENCNNQLSEYYNLTNKIKSLTGSENMYAPTIIYKTIETDMFVIYLNGYYILIKDKFLYNIFDDIHEYKKKIVNKNIETIMESIDGYNDIDENISKYWEYLKNEALDKYSAVTYFYLTPNSESKTPSSIEYIIEKYPYSKPTDKVKSLVKDMINLIKIVGFVNNTMNIIKEMSKDYDT
jgi:hypothetical protein